MANRVDWLSLPNDSYEKIAEPFQAPGFLYDYKSMLTMKAVCRTWRDNPSLQEAYRDAQDHALQRIQKRKVHQEMMIEREYPLELRQLFRQCGIPIAQLPVLGLGNYERSQAYITFIEPRHMSHPIMRFNDAGRPGIALHLRHTLPPGRYTVLGEELELTEPFDFHNVYSFFKRYSREDHPESTRWEYAWGNNDANIRRSYDKEHRRRHSDCWGGCPEKFVGLTNEASIINQGLISRHVLRNLLTGQDPIASLSAPVVQ